jgi:hypothetical protein
MQALKAARVCAAEIAFPDLPTLQDCVRLGPPLTTYTLNDVHCSQLSDQAALGDPDFVWGALIRAGVSGIMTDQSNRLARYMRDGVG